MISRRQFTKGAVSGCFVLFSGCVNLEGQKGGKIIFLKYKSAPEEAKTVESSDSRIASLDVIQKGLQKLSTRSSVTIELTPSEYKSVDGKFSNVPYFNRRKHHGSSYPSGYYVEKSEFIARIDYKPYCSDFPGVRSKRNGDCYTKR